MHAIRLQTYKLIRSKPRLLYTVSMLKISIRSCARFIRELQPACIWKKSTCNHSVGRHYIGMARMPASRNTFSKPPNSQTKELQGFFYVASYNSGPLL